jgi:hypothetical protein
MVTLPRLTGRLSWPIAVGVLVLVVGTGAFLFATQPTHRTGAIVAPLILLALLGGLLLTSKQLDTTAGRLVTTRLLVLRQTLDLASVTGIDVVDNKAGEAMLSLKGSGARTFVSLLHLTATVQRSLDAPTLKALADGVERFVAPGVAGRDAVTAQLRAQAAHVADGGAPSDSPLASVVR